EMGTESAVQGQLHSLRARLGAIGRQRISAIVGRGVELKVVPVDEEDIGRVVDAARESPLRTELIVLRLVRPVDQQRRAHLERPGERNRIGTPAPEAFRVDEIRVQCLVDLVGGIELENVTVDRISARDICDTQNSGAAKRTTVGQGAEGGALEILLEESGTAGDLPLRAQVAGQFAEKRSVEETGRIRDLVVDIAGRCVRAGYHGEIAKRV